MNDARPVDPTFAFADIRDGAEPGATRASRLAGVATLAFALAILAGLAIVAPRNPPTRSLDAALIDALYGP